FSGNGRDGVRHGHDQPFRSFRDGRTANSRPEKTGRALIHSPPPVATTPDMTAVWEAAMRALVDGQPSLGAFLARVNAQLGQLIDDGRALGQIAVPPTGAAAHPRSAADARKPTRTRGARRLP